METPLLDSINLPRDLRKLDSGELPQLAQELRRELVASVSKTGGHLGSSLGVVELTVALHYVFDTPEDRLIWDVGHQSYPHKILTGRRKKMATLRRRGGLYGFTKRSESEYDPFGAAHSSTSISAALGMSAAARFLRKKRRVVAVIGDGAMSAGLAYEAINNAGALKLPLIVVLNDNDMSIAPPTGAMSNYLSRLLSGDMYMGMRRGLARRLKFLPGRWRRLAAKTEEYARGIVVGGTLFEELGFYYVGPVDGHNIKHLIRVLGNIKKYDFPILLHVVTKKGYGYEPAESSADKFHGVGKFCPTSGKIDKAVKGSPSFTDVFAANLIKHAEKDEKIVAITAAMPDGTGLDKFAARFPQRMFDVGIAEQHAVTFGGALAAEGMKPFVAIYSTFLQRAYDQVIHDVAIQNLAVRFAIDRAGLVGADGETHGGTFDLAYLGAVPNFTVVSPADEAELARAVATAVGFNSGPFAFRYPRGSGVGAAVDKNPKPFKLGKGRIIKRGITKGGDGLAIISIGAILYQALAAAELLRKRGITATIADARFLKPLDTELLATLANEHSALMTVEEGSCGGFAASVSAFLAEGGYFDDGIKYRSLFLPDRFIPHGSQPEQIADANLTPAAIAELGLKLVKP